MSTHETGKDFFYRYRPLNLIKEAPRDIRLVESGENNKIIQNNEILVCQQEIKFYKISFTDKEQVITISCRTCVLENDKFLMLQSHEKDIIKIKSMKFKKLIFMLDKEKKNTICENENIKKMIYSIVTLFGGKITYSKNIFDELKNKEIYLASIEENNDPMDGEFKCYWQGDTPIWKNLI